MKPVQDQVVHAPQGLPEPRILLGAGPSMAPPSVLQAMAAPLLGYLDPEFLGVLADIRRLLRTTFQTENEWTLAVSGTGTAAMETALGNLIEPGDRVLACVHGYFGARLADMAARYGAEVHAIQRDWGQAFDPDEIRAALRPGIVKLVTLVHAETSTGVLQSGIAEIAAACHEAGALLVLDCVTSLGCVPVTVDAWDVDVAYSAGQKGISAPPGLSPITIGPRARKAIQARRSPPPAFYFDLRLLTTYWGDSPAYHHTAPISTAFALREALRLVQEEGLEARFARHRANSELLWKGLEALDLPLFVAPPNRLVPLTTVLTPPGRDEAAIRRRLLMDHNIEIAGGFGPLAGKVWRIGLMGYSSMKENVANLTNALESLLRSPE
ncbi:MAG: alanine--glyoxylate aminotransferase family protein [Anaerolineales bacterium]